MAVGETGDVYTWGRAKEGQLGNGEVRNNALKPVRVEGLRHERVVNGTCGYYHCLAITASGRLYQWGKLHKHVNGADKEYFGMAIGLSGLQSERMKRMVDRSHNAYYAGTFPQYHQQRFLMLGTNVKLQPEQLERRWRSCRVSRISEPSRPTCNRCQNWSPLFRMLRWSKSPLDTLSPLL